jgi:hypothetical protein
MGAERDVEKNAVIMKAKNAGLSNAKIAKAAGVTSAAITRTVRRETGIAARTESLKNLRKLIRHQNPSEATIKAAALDQDVPEAELTMHDGKAHNVGEHIIEVFTTADGSKRTFDGYVKGKANGSGLRAEGGYSTVLAPPLSDSPADLVLLRAQFPDMKPRNLYIVETQAVSDDARQGAAMLHIAHRTYIEYCVQNYNLLPLASHNARGMLAFLATPEGLQLRRLSGPALTAQLAALGYDSREDALLDPEAAARLKKWDAEVKLKHKIAKAKAGAKLRLSPNW